MGGGTKVEKKSSGVVKVKKEENEVFAPPTPTRVDLGELKKRLRLALKHHANDYWINVKKYVTAKLTKRELDESAREFLGENLWLHNRFFQAILNNAHHSVPPKLPARVTPPPVPASPKKSSKKKKKSTNGETAALPKAISLELRKAALQPISAITKRAEPVGVGLPQLHRLGRKAQRSLPVSNLDHQLVGAPRLLALRQRMLQTALSWGLADVGNDAVEYMMAALEHHMKRIIGVCNSSVPLNQKRVRALRMSVQRVDTPVPGQGVAAALLPGGEESSKLWRENLPLVQERLVLEQV